MSTFMRVRLPEEFASKLTDSHFLPSSQLLSIAYFVDNLLVSVLLPPVMGSSPPVESAANMF